MGTLLEQKPRNFRKVETKDVEERLKEFISIAKSHKVSLSDVINTAKIMEQERSNDLFAANGDIHDEQMMGIGEILTNIEGSIGFYVEKSK